MEMLAVWSFFIYKLVQLLNKEGLIWDALIILVISALIAAPIALIIKAIADNDFWDVFKVTLGIIFGVLLFIYILL